MNPEVSDGVKHLPPKIAFGFSEGTCNLACPKCPAHGARKRTDNPYRGAMPLNLAERLLDELGGSGTIVHPYAYYEPFVHTEIWDYIRAATKRGLPVHLNTNGLLVTADVARRLVDAGVESIFVSIDATTADTLRKVRGAADIERVSNAVSLLLDARGARNRPRIGVSFTVEEANRPEQDAFVRRWIPHVDVVRVAQLYALNRPDAGPKQVRVPCPVLYDTLLVHFNGDAAICCLDASGRSFAGNVLDHGVQRVWSGSALSHVRGKHEAADYDQVPLCANCADWPRYGYSEGRIADGLLVRSSPLLTYYNRLDRLSDSRLPSLPEVLQTETSVV